MKSNAKTLLLFTALMLPGLAMAQSFPCGQVGASPCDTSSPLRVETQTTKPSVIKDDGFAALLKGMNLQGVVLSEEQRMAILTILQNQEPAIIEHVQTIEAAQGFLREMALSKRYDEALANALVKTIAENSANLALLEAAREYQVFALLTPEQIKGLKLGRNG